MEVSKFQPARRYKVRAGGAKDDRLVSLNLKNLKGFSGRSCKGSHHMAVTSLLVVLLALAAGVPQCSCLIGLDWPRNRLPVIPGIPSGNNAETEDLAPPTSPSSPPPPPSPPPPSPPPPISPPPPSPPQPMSPTNELAGKLPSQTLHALLHLDTRSVIR